MGGCPGLVVMGDSRSVGHEFESQRHILDGHFFALICCKNCIGVCLQRPKIKEKVDTIISSGEYFTLVNYDSRVVLTRKLPSMIRTVCILHTFSL